MTEEGGTSNTGSGMGPGYSDSESGVPGGWGAEANSGSNSGDSSTPAATVTTPSGGTYTDDQGRPISREQAILSGRIDNPGVSQFERIQGLTPGSGPTPPPPQGPPPELQPRVTTPNAPPPLRGPSVWQSLDPNAPGYPTIIPVNPAGKDRLVKQQHSPVFVRGIGWMVPRELVESGKQTAELRQIAKENEPMFEEHPIIGTSYNISRSPEYTYPIEKGGLDIAAGINNRTSQYTGNGADALQFGGRVVGNVIAGLAIIPSAVEATTRTAITTPEIIPGLVIQGAERMGMDFMKSIDKAPLETLASLYVGGKVIQAAGKATDIVKVGKIETETAQPKIITPPSDYPFDIGGETGASVRVGKTGYEIVPRPEILTKAEATATVYQGVSLEAGKKSQPIIGVTEGDVTNRAAIKIGDKTLVVGTPKFTPESTQQLFETQFKSKEGYEYFQSPTELKIAKENIIKGYTPEEQSMVENRLAKRELSYGVNSKFSMGDIPLEDVLNPENKVQPQTAANLRNYLESKKGEIDIWGSIAQKAQVVGEGQTRYHRTVGDIDIHTPNPELTRTDLVNIVEKTQPGQGSEIVSHLFDIKPHEAPEISSYTSGSLAGKQGKIFGFNEEPVAKIGKFEAVSLSEQTTAKLGGSTGLRETGASGHPGRVVKDTFDLTFIDEPTLTESMPWWNPFKKAKAKALDVKLQEEAIAKSKRDFTPEQSTQFNKLIEDMRSGQVVESTPVKQRLISKNTEPTTSSGIAAPTPVSLVKQTDYITAYNAAKDTAAQQPYANDITAVHEPHSPAKVDTLRNKRQAEELADKITKDLQNGGMNVRYNRRTATIEKVPDSFDMNQGPEPILDIEYFNKPKDQRSIAFNKGFASEDLTGMNALSLDLRKTQQVGDLSILAKYYGNNPADVPILFPDAEYGGRSENYDREIRYRKTRQARENIRTGRYRVDREPYTPPYRPDRTSGRTFTPPPYRPDSRPPGTPPYRPQGEGYRIPPTPKPPSITIPPYPKKKPGDDDENRAEIKIDNKFFRTSRKSPIAAASTDLSGVRKAMGIAAPKTRRRRKK